MSRSRKAGEAEMPMSIVREVAGLLNSCKQKQLALDKVVIARYQGLSYNPVSFSAVAWRSSGVTSML
jgi:hypothetical protein